MQITHKLNGPCVSHTYGLHGLGFAIATSVCVFVMEHIHTWVPPLHTHLATYLL